MTKQVTFATPQPPGYGVGDKALVPDDVAARLEKSGDISASEIWPPAVQKPRRPIIKVERPGAPRDLLSEV